MFWAGGGGLVVSPLEPDSVSGLMEMFGLTNPIWIFPIIASVALLYVTGLLDFLDD